MPVSDAKRRAALGVAVATVATALSTVGAGTAHAAAAADRPCGIVFDDFDYSSHGDPSLAANGWIARGGSGGPGVGGATWSPAAVAFPAVDGDKVAQLSAATDGTSGGTVQAELFQSRFRFFEGTYASRVRFTDAPASGTDGDHVVETFFAISPLRYDMDPTYSELDFEYLPNGGWGAQGPINYQTTWYTYQGDPWYADNVHAEQRRSFEGWHDLVLQVGNGHVRYYIDGKLVADHSGKYYPRQPMVVSYNLWFIDTAGHTGGTSTYVEQIDWFSYTEGRLLPPAQATSRAAAYRAAGVRHLDTLGEGGGCNPPAHR